MTDKQISPDVYPAWSAQHSSLWRVRLSWRERDVLLSMTMVQDSLYYDVSKSESDESEYQGDESEDNRWNCTKHYGVLSNQTDTESTEDKEGCKDDYKLPRNSWTMPLSIVRGQ